MAFVRYRYRDVTGQADAEARAEQVPEWREGFLQLGFRRLGFMEAINLDDINDRQVTEVLVSADVQAFVKLGTTVSPFVPPSPASAFITTALDDGALVTTGMGVVARDLEKPQEGYYLHFVEGASPATLWERHRARVEDISRARGVLPMRHANMRLRLVVADRAIELLNGHLRIARVFAWLALVVIGGLLFGLFLGARVVLGDWLPGDEPVPFWVWAVVFSVIITLRISQRCNVQLWLYGLSFANYWPGPPPRPFDDTDSRQGAAL